MLNENILKSIFEFYAGFGNRTNKLWLYSSKFKKFLKDCQLQEKINIHSFDLIFIKLAKQIDVNRNRVDFQGFLKLFQNLSQKLGFEFISSKLLSIYKKFNTIQDQIKLKSIQMAQNYVKIITNQFSFRKLYKNYFHIQIVSQISLDQDLKRMSLKSLLLLLKDAQVFPGLITKTSITNLYNYTLQSFDKLDVIQQGRKFTFVKFLNVMARLPNFLNATQQVKSDNMNQIFQKLINRNLISNQKKFENSFQKNIHQIDTFHMTLRATPNLHKDLSPARTKNKLKKSFLQTPKGQNYFAALCSSNQKKKKFNQLQKCSITIRNIFKHYAQNQGQYKQRITYYQAKKIVLDNKNLFHLQQFDLNLIFSSASKGKSSLDIKQFQNYIQLLHQKSLRSINLYNFIHTLYQTCNYTFYNAYCSSIAALRFIQQDQTLIKLIILITRILRNSIIKFFQKDVMLQEDAKRYLKQTNIFPNYLSVKKLHQYFQILQNDGYLTVQNFVKLLALCSQNIKVKGQPIIMRLKFLFLVILHSKGFSNTIKFSSTKGQFQNIYLQISKILKNQEEII